MGNLGEPSPYDAHDAAGFVESMRQLKEHSGRTYRELEEQAARNGDVLARSTLADILRRTSLPRPNVLTVFVRACGDGQRVGAWLDARDRIAAAVTAAPAVTPGSGPDTETAVQPQTEHSTASQPHRTKGRMVALTATLMVLPLALGAWGLLAGSSDDSAAPSRTPAGGWVTIRPARSLDLCLTEGRDRHGAYASAVAVQLTCARATVPRTYLEPAGGDLYRIQWHHPQEGKGCLTVMSTGPARGLLEPRNDCTRATLFHLETPAADNAGGFRLRPANSSRCIGIASHDTAEGAEAAEEPCTGATDQRFVIRQAE